jgi:CRISPR-associated protein Csd1
MMLKALYDLANREELLESPNYEKKKVDYFLRINEKGDLIGLEGPLERKIDTPRLTGKRTSGVDPGFLFDKAQYVFGLGGKPTRNQECFKKFYERVERAAKTTNDLGALALLAFSKKQSLWRAEIQAKGPKQQDTKYPEAWTGGEMIACCLGDELDPIHLRPALKTAWDKERETQQEGALSRCLVTGELRKPERKHAAINNVPGGQTSGTPLVSFNDEAFCSHGLKQGDNAPISRVANEGYSTALNWLLDKFKVVIPATENKKEVTYSRHRYGVTTGENAITVFWTREKSSFINIFSSGFDTTPADAEALLQSIRKGEASTADETAFFAMTLGGNSGRIVVRDWFESTLVEIKKNILRYFEDLQLGPKEKPLPLRYLLKALASPGKNGGLAPALGTRFFQAALRNRPFPREVLGLALRRLRLPPKENEETRYLYERCAVIKAVLRRLPRPNQPEVTVSLDEQNTQTPYLLGRLFAVLERLQAIAIDKPNATIRDRYFASASSTPSLVFSRLIRLSNHHLSKVDERGYFVSRIGKIMAPLTGFPRTLSLEDQGLFAIGYYHQREDFFSKKPTTEDNNKQEKTE